MISILEALDKLNFDYGQIAKSIWGELLRDAKKQFKIWFDTENDDGVDNFRDITIPQKQ